MTDSLAASCAELARLLPAAAALLAMPDEDGTTGTGQPSSRPPWNGRAAAAYTDATEGVRRLEASLRWQRFGHTGLRRGGSDANTMAAVEAIVGLAYAISEDDAAIAAAILGRWSRHIQELRAIDESEPWLRVRGATCPYCKVAMLRLRRRAGRVVCLRHGACFDKDGKHPEGLIGQSVSGDPIVAWNDGYIQHAAIEAIDEDETAVVAA